jgi:putative (di)nucleoside polyphosphate hydrolase
MDPIDNEGFRPNVGIMIADGKGRLLLAKRIGQDAWQFPQGGIHTGEEPHEAMYRELYEEVGLAASDVEIIGHTNDWLYYRLPKRYIRRGSTPLCIGQKQKWYLLRLAGDHRKIRFDRSEKPEFDGWKWVNYWYPINQVIEFKKDVYRRALKELAHIHGEIERKFTKQKY